METKDLEVSGSNVGPVGEATTKSTGRRAESKWHRQLLAELEEIFVESPVELDELAHAIAELRPGEAIRKNTVRRLHIKLKDRLEETWRAKGYVDSQSTVMRLYSPCQELIHALAVATGLSQQAVLEFVLRDFAGQVFSGRFNLVESIVATKLQDNSVMKTTMKLLDRIDLSNDARLKDIGKARWEHRKRQIKFNNFVFKPVEITDEVV